MPTRHVPRRWATHWDKHAYGYDKSMGRFERISCSPTPPVICGQAVADTLKSAVVTGLNLPHYPADVALTASTGARGGGHAGTRRTAGHGRRGDLHRAVTSVVASPRPGVRRRVVRRRGCAVLPVRHPTPDDQTAVAEMVRVFAPRRASTARRPHPSSRGRSCAIQARRRVVIHPRGGSISAPPQPSLVRPPPGHSTPGTVSPPASSNASPRANRA